MELLGYFTLTFFLVAMVLTLLKKINLPVQTVLVLVTLVCLGAGAVYLGLTEGMAAVLELPNQMMSGIILHPITALLSGLFIAGALAATGGFEAFKVIITKLQKTPLGLAGTMVILIQFPMIASLPCGRIIAAALLPLLFAFGAEGGLNLLTRAQLIVLIGAFSRNAFGSCGPSPIGGVGQIGEGFLGSHFPTAADGILRAPQIFALMVGTALTALFLKLISQKLYPDDVALKDKKVEEKSETKKVSAPIRGYVTLAIFFAALAFAIFQPITLPVQTIMVAATILIMVVGRAKVRDLMSGIILLPVSAMIAGFMAAGALAATGGFDALGTILKAFSDFPILGTAGMIAIFIQIQTMIPLSCSRILTAALVPVLYYFGPDHYALLTWNQLAVVMAAYIINATTSCGPSPLGGGGMMGEGQMRAESGYIKGAYTFTAMATMAPLAAIFMRFLNLSSFSPVVGESQKQILDIIGFGILIVVVNIAVIAGINRMITGKEQGDYRIQVAGFLIGGVLAGVVLALSVFGFSIVPALQGGFGGLLAALWIAFMVPKRLTVQTEASA